MCQNCGQVLNGEPSLVVQFSRKSSIALRLCADVKPCNRRRRALDEERYGK